MTARRIELITLPLRSIVLLVLLWTAYTYGYGSPSELWREESPETGTVARYTMNGRPWRIFYDRNGDRQWDMWIDERSGAPAIVSIDEDQDGRAELEQDEFGNTLPSWSVARFRAQKTFSEFLHKPRQLQYVAFALMVYAVLEFFVRWFARGEP